MREYITVFFGSANGNVSTEQREEIVRCRDCEFFVRDKLGECCTLMDFERVGGMADGFCAWGERKEANYERQDD